MDFGSYATVYGDFPGSEECTSTLEYVVKGIDYRDSNALNITCLEMSVENNATEITMCLLAKSTYSLHTIMKHVYTCIRDGNNDLAMSIAEWCPEVIINSREACMVALYSGNMEFIDAVISEDVLNSVIYDAVLRMIEGVGTTTESNIITLLPPARFDNITVLELVNAHVTNDRYTTALGVLIDCINDEKELLTLAIITALHDNGKVCSMLVRRINYIR